MAGSLTLLRETPARPWVGLDEMEAELAALAPGPHGAGEPAAAAAPAEPPRLRRRAALASLGPAEGAVANAVCRAPATPDALVASTGLAPGVVAGALMLLHLRGWVQPVGPAYLPAGPLLGGDR